LANLLNEAALLAARTGKKAVGMKELEEARDKVRWGRERRSLAMTDEEKRFTAWHEAGHALVNVLLNHTHPLHKVTIIPRGQSLGSTMYLPEKDVINQARKQMLDLISVIMAGRIAEELVSGDISTGASSDIKQATNLARSMVCQWGMSEKLGMVQYGADDEYFLGRDMMRRKDYSEATAREIDEEVRRIIEERHQVANDLITSQRDKLEAIANALLEFETLEGWQVEEIIRTGRFTPSGTQVTKIDPPTGAQAATPLPEVPKPTPPKLPGFGAPAPAAA
jgi:cell division protease FtsH